MKLRKALLYLAIGIVIAMPSHNFLSGSTGKVVAETITPPLCLTSHRYATAGGTEKLVHHYEGTERTYWLYDTYGRADTEQQYPMELIAITKADECSVKFWNAPGHAFSYSEYVPLDVAKQFALAGLKLHQESIGEEAFREYYSSLDRSNLDQETQWALEQLDI